jgi:hypothetical protein
MFPDRIGRLLIDGVVNAHDYYIGMHHKAHVTSQAALTLVLLGNFSSSVLDTEQALTNIYEACFEAGPSACAIFENSTDLIRERVTNLTDSIHKAPLPLYNNSDPANIQFSTVDYSLVTQFIGQAVYSPYSLAPTFAEAIVEMEQGNGTTVFETTPGSGVDSGTADLFSCSSSFSQPFSTGFLEITAAIGCGDRLDPVATGLQSSLSAYQELAQISPFYGPIFFAESAGPCS